MIELLVVITTVAVLVALMLPGLSGARASSKDGKCLATLGQLGRSMQAAHQSGVEYGTEEWEEFFGKPRCPSNRTALKCYSVTNPLLTPEADHTPWNKLVVAWDFKPWHSFTQAGFLDGHAERDRTGLIGGE